MRAFKPCCQFENCFCYFIFRVGGNFACVRLLPLTLYCIINTSFFPRISGIRLFFPLSAAHRFSVPNFPGEMTFRPTVKVSRMDLFCEFYD